jgi:hypothetical protein
VLDRSACLLLCWLGLAACEAKADSGFIPLPLPATPAPPPPRVEPSAEVERAVRTTRQRVEERELERRGSQPRLERYRDRELRELERRPVRVPDGDSRRVDADIARARERLELERRVGRIERDIRARELTGAATRDLPR